MSVPVRTSSSACFVQKTGTRALPGNMAAVKLKTMIDGMKKMHPCIVAITNPNLMDRHWIQLEKITGVDIKAKVDSFASKAGAAAPSQMGEQSLRMRGVATARFFVVSKYASRGSGRP